MRFFFGIIVGLVERFLKIEMLLFTLIFPLTLEAGY
jgi:hypothetical protein